MIALSILFGILLSCHFCLATDCLVKMIVPIITVSLMLLCELSAIYGRCKILINMHFAQRHTVVANDTSFKLCSIPDLMKIILCNIHNV